VNLLALNTAIRPPTWAGRASGFSVIAKEIKKLAESTGRHSDEIAATLRKIVDSAENHRQMAGKPDGLPGTVAGASTEILDSFRAISEKMRQLGEGAGRPSSL